MHALRRHPDSRPPPVTALSAHIEPVAPDGLHVTFELSGDVSALAIAPPKAPLRRDDLWRTTCFEVFLRRPGERPYLEFNLAPSGEWAAYAFEETRRRLQDPLVDPPGIVFEQTPDRIRIAARLALPPAYQSQGGWQIGLTAVIETRDCELSYWSLAHPPGRPDFHNDAGFVLDVPAPSTPSTVRP